MLIAQRSVVSAMPRHLITTDQYTELCANADQRLCACNNTAANVFPVHTYLGVLPCETTPINNTHYHWAMAAVAPPAAETAGVQQQGTDQPALPCRFHATVDFHTPEDALAVCKCLSADKELRPDQVSKLWLVSSTCCVVLMQHMSSMPQVTKQLSTDGATLHAHFAAVDIRTLRAAVGAFCDLLALATRTLEAFPRIQRGS